MISSRNAVRHGFRSHDMIINSPALKESKEEYDQLLASVFEELRPQSFFQAYLARRIAICLWRSRRAVRAETAAIHSQLDDVENDLNTVNAFNRLLNPDAYADNGPDSPQAQQRLRSAIIGVNSIPGPAAGHNILRYEMRLDRQLNRAYSLLIHLQKCSNSKPSNKKPGKT